MTTAGITLDFSIFKCYIISIQNNQQKEENKCAPIDFIPAKFK